MSQVYRRRSFMFINPEAIHAPAIAKAYVYRPLENAGDARTNASDRMDARDPVYILAPTDVHAATSAMNVYTVRDIIQYAYKKMSSSDWIESLLGYDRRDHPSPATRASVHVTWTRIKNACSGDGHCLTAIAEAYGHEYTHVHGCRFVIDDHGARIVRTGTSKMFRSGSNPYQIRVSSSAGAYRYRLLDLLVRAVHGSVPFDRSYRTIVADDGVYLENDDDRSALNEYLKAEMLKKGIVPISRTVDGTLLRDGWYTFNKGILCCTRNMRPISVMKNGQIAVFTDTNKRIMKQIGELVAYAYKDILRTSDKHTVFDHISCDHTDHASWNLRPMTQRQNNMVRTGKNSEKPSFEHCSQFIPDREQEYEHLKKLSPDQIAELVEKGDLVLYDDCYFHTLGIVYNKKGVRKNVMSGRYDKYIFYISNGKMKLVHRSMAFAFKLPRPEGADRVNHKVSDHTNRYLRQDNRLSNLNWTDVRGNSITKKVKVMFYDGDTVASEKVYESMREAADDTGIHLSSIQRVAAAGKKKNEIVKATHVKTNKTYSVNYV